MDDEASRFTVPNPLTTAMIATEMPAAIRPYSIAVRQLKERGSKRTSILFECNAKLLAVCPSHPAVADLGVPVDDKLKYLWNAKCSAETEPCAVKCQVGDGARKFVACRPISNGSAQVHGFAGMFSAVVH